MVKKMVTRLILSSWDDEIVTAHFARRCRSRCRFADSLSEERLETDREDPPLKEIHPLENAHWRMLEGDVIAAWRFSSCIASVHADEDQVFQNE